MAIFRITNQLVEEKQLLDGCTDVVEYASKRLGWDKQTKQNALKSNPLFTKCKISKVKRTNFFLSSFKNSNQTHSRLKSISTFC